MASLEGRSEAEFPQAWCKMSAPGRSSLPPFGSVRDRFAETVGGRFPADVEQKCPTRDAPMEARKNARRPFPRRRGAKTAANAGGRFSRNQSAPGVLGGRFPLDVEQKHPPGPTLPAADASRHFSGAVRESVLLTIKRFSTFFIFAKASEAVFH